MAGTITLEPRGRVGRRRAVSQAAHHAAAPAPPTVQLLGVSLHAVTQAESVRTVMEALDEGRGGWIVTPNLDHLRRCVTSQRYAATIRHADLRVADGMPLIWASRVRGTPLPERVAGSDLICPLSQALASARRSLFLVGGAPGTASKAAEILQSRFPGLRIAGTCCPQMKGEREPEVVRAIAAQIRACSPDVVLVALGCPKQEYLIRTLHSLFPQTWWIGVGISFSFVCGQVRRAPRWMQRCGIEWLHRLCQEPRRLWKRYLLHGLPFAMLLMFTALLSRLRAGWLGAWLIALAWRRNVIRKYTDLNVVAHEAIEQVMLHEDDYRHDIALY